MVLIDRGVGKCLKYLEQLLVDSVVLMGKIDFFPHK
jgi:hypothetical protein